jgi:PAS domain S-box-containing protein
MIRDSPSSVSSPPAVDAIPTPTARKRSRGVPFAVLLAGLTATGVASTYIAQNARTKDELRFENLVAQTHDSIQARLNTYISLLRGTSGLFAASNNVAYGEFARYVQHLRLREVYPGIQGVGFSARVRPGEEASLVARMRRQGFPDYRLWPEVSDAVSSAGENRHAIMYLEPPDRRNRRARGFNMYSEPTRRAAMQRARDTGEVSATGKVLLVQEIEAQKQNGFLMYVPIYNGLPRDLAERRRFLQGFVYSPFRTGDLLYGIVSEDTFTRLTLRVYDGPVNEQNLLFNSQKQNVKSAHSPFQTTRPITVAGRTWNVQFQSGPGFEYTLGNDLARWVLIGGVLLSVLLWTLTRSLVRAQENAEDRATQLQHSQGALRLSEARAWSVIESNVAGVFFADQDGHITDANDAFLQMIGYTREELQQSAIKWMSITPPEWAEADSQCVQNLMEHGVQAPYEKEFIRRDGTRVPVLTGVALMKSEGQYDTGVAFVLDLSERKHAEAERRVLTERFQLMADSAPVLIWMCDAQNRGTWFNKRWLQFTGRSMEEECGMGWGETIHPDDRERSVTTCSAAIQRRESFTMEFRLCRHDGEYRWMLDTGVPLYDSKDEFSGYIGSCIDITEHKRAEQERTALLERERTAREKAEVARLEAEDANRTKDEFLATLSHELRTPLNSIIGWSHLLRDNRLGPDERTQGLDAIARNAKTQAQLVEDLLDMSRIISGKLRLDLHPLQPGSTLQNAIDAIRPAAEAKQLEVITDIKPDCGPISADAVRLQQIVWNLLNNAVKFTPHGGRIELAAQCMGRWLQIRVSDNGVGIAPQFLPHIFDRFRQADSSSTRAHGGLGLGLSIVRHLVERHGGNVRAESDGDGQGSTFIVELPLMSVPEASRNQGAATLGNNNDELAHAEQRLQNLKVLVVEDEADTRQVLQIVMQSEGAQVQTAASVVEAWPLLQDFQPNVLISDIGLPGEDGYSFIRRLRQNGQATLSSIPAIALTAYAGTEAQRHAHEAGFQEHINKPATPETIINAVERLGHIEEVTSREL